MKIVKSYNFLEIEEYLKKNFSSPTHWPEWNLLVSKYFGSDFYYFTAVDNNEIIGICPVHEEKNGLFRNLFSGQYHYIPYGGWLLSRKYRINKLPLKYNQIFISHSFPRIKENKVKYGINSHKTNHTLLIDLKNPLNEIWKNEINEKKRNRIRKAENNKVSIEVNENRIDEFYELYSKTNAEKKLCNLPVDFFYEMNSFKNICVKFVFAVCKNKILHINVLLFDTNYAIHWLSVSASKNISLGQGELAQYESIKFLKETRCKYYDLCYIDKDRFPNIYKFKKGFSNIEMVVPLIIQKSLSYKIINKVTKLLLPG